MDPNVGTVVPSKLISVRVVHPLNALVPILVTVEGIIMYSRPVQPWNALAPRLVIDVGRETLVIPVQPWNAFAPILVTPDDTISEVIIV